jgi:hypothetical protein
LVGEDPVPPVHGGCSDNLLKAHLLLLPFSVSSAIGSVLAVHWHSNN